MCEQVDGGDYPSIDLTSNPVYENSRSAFKVPRNVIHN